MQRQLLSFSILIFISVIFARTAIAANVIVKPITMERSEKKVQAVGDAEAIRSVTLYPAVGDKVTAVHFAPGDKVEAGEILLELDSRRQKTALSEAKITFNDTQRTVERLIESHAKGAVPQSDLDDAKTLFELAKVAVTQAETELEDRTVIAPFGGIMGLTDVEVGDRITPQTAIATIDDTSSLYINFNAPESAINILKTEGEVVVIPWQGEQQVAAKVAYLDSRIDSQTRTLRVKAKVNNNNQQFIPGMSFRVHIQSQGDNFAVIPEAALLWGATGPYVWKSIDKKAVRVDVKIAQRLAGRLLVSGNLKTDDLLVVEGVQTLRSQQDLIFNSTSSSVQE